MATESEARDTNEKPAAAKEPEAPKPKSTPDTQAGKDAVEARRSEPRTAATTKEDSATQASVPPTKKILTGDEDDEELDSKATFELSASAFRKRIDRANKATLKELFGTDDVEAIKKERENYLKLKETAEEERRKKLDEVTRLKEDKEKAEARAAEAERRAQEVENKRQLDEEVRALTRVAAKHLDEEYVEDIINGPFHRYVADLSDREREKLTERDVDGWFAEYAQKKPKLAKGYVEQKPKVLPATNGIVDNKRPAQVNGKDLTEKTPKPGQPNSMSRAEYNEWKKRQGYA